MRRAKGDGTITVENTRATSTKDLLPAAKMEKVKNKSADS